MTRISRKKNWERSFQPHSSPRFLWLRRTMHLNAGQRACSRFENAPARRLPTGLRKSEKHRLAQRVLGTQQTHRGGQRRLAAAQVGFKQGVSGAKVAGPAEITRRARIIIPDAQTARFR